MYFQFSGATLLGATIWEYENMRSHALKKLKQPMKFFRRKLDDGFQQTVSNWGAP